MGKVFIFFISKLCSKLGDFEAILPPSILLETVYCLSLSYFQIFICKDVYFYEIKNIIIIIS